MLAFPSDVRLRRTTARQGESMCGARLRRTSARQGESMCGVRLRRASARQGVNMVEAVGFEPTSEQGTA